jgi:hypothetical protein
MASNYIDELNALYNTRVFLKESVGLGPNAESDEDYEAPVRRCMKCEEEAEECNCTDKKSAKSEDDMVFARDEEEGGYDQDEFSQTGEHPHHQASNMVKQNLYRIAKMAAMLHDIIPCDSEIEEWVADKIAKAEESVSSVFGYKDYEAHKGEVERDIEIEEKTEQDLYKSINDGGDALVNKIKELMRNQPREKVEDTVYGMIKMLEA